MYSIHIFLYQKELIPEIENYHFTLLGHYPDTENLHKIATEVTASEYFLFYTGNHPLQLSSLALERMIQIAQMSEAALVYSDYYQIKAGIRIQHPTLEYQIGSLRDDFDFGPLLLFCARDFRQAVNQMDSYYQYAALYDLRLKISQHGRIVHLPEYLYTIEETDLRLSGEKQFDYVNPKNREVQIEMEKACTSHLKTIKAWLVPEFESIDLNSISFQIEASVIIPVRNRAKTITDAVKSALTQQTAFPYNVIVIDNFSTDGTTEILKGLAKRHSRLIHLIPNKTDLGIGGCWTEAIMHPQCGKFAIQLDSDDLYNSTHSIQTIVDTFYQQNCAMVIGSYQMVNFQLQEIPPGIIAHQEWTPDNGRNNALRINGLGAPRAFYTPLIRKLKFPNVSYGEDYAVGLAISRHYQIGRIYEPIYLCRRWEENSDAALNVQQLNTYNFYKDKLRTLEILARISEIKIKNEK